MGKVIDARDRFGKTERDLADERLEAMIAEARRVSQALRRLRMKITKSGR